MEDWCPEIYYDPLLRARKTAKGRRVSRRIHASDMGLGSLGITISRPHRLTSKPLSDPQAPYAARVIIHDLSKIKHEMILLLGSRSSPVRHDADASCLADLDSIFSQFPGCHTGLHALPCTV